MTPSVEPQPTSVTAALSGPTSLGGAICESTRFHFARALFHHQAALGGVGEFVADQRAVLVVFIRGRDMDVAGHAGDGARRDAALGEFVTQIGIVIRAAEGIGRRAVAVRENDFAAVDLRFEIQFFGINARGAFGDEQIRQHEAGALVIYRTD